MQVLIVHASRMGGTAEIAERIGQRLREAGFEVDVRACLGAPAAAQYDAVIVGSALYTRRWERAATGYLKANAADLARKLTWLFHSGPCGEGAENQPVAAGPKVRRLARRIGTSAPVTFGGRLDPTKTVNRIQRWVASGTEAGDWRDWDRIDRWAADIAAELTAPADDWSAQTRLTK